MGSELFSQPSRSLGFAVFIRLFFRALFPQGTIGTTSTRTRRVGEGVDTVTHKFHPYDNKPESQKQSKKNQFFWRDWDWEWEWDAGLNRPFGLNSSFLSQISCTGSYPKSCIVHLYSTESFLYLSLKE